MIAALLAALSAGAALHWIADVLFNAGAWLLQYPRADAGIALALFAGAANKLQASPYAAKSGTVVKVLRGAVDVLGLLPHEDAYGFLYGLLWHLLGKKLPAGAAQVIAEKALRVVFGWWNIPIAPSVSKAEPHLAPDSAPVRLAGGFALVPFLVTLFAGGAVLLIGSALLEASGTHAIFGALCAVAAIYLWPARRGAAVLVLAVVLGSSSARAQSIDPPSPRGGGCFRAGQLCLGPDVAVTFGSFGTNMDRLIKPALTYSGGYALTGWAREWYATSIGLYPSITNDGKATGCAIGGFAGYVRVGLCHDSDGRSRIVAGLGSNLGMTSSTPPAP